MTAAGDHAAGLAGPCAELLRWLPAAAALTALPDAGAAAAAHAVLDAL